MFYSAVKAHDLSGALSLAVLGPHSVERPTAPHRLGIVMSVLLRHSDMDQAPNEPAGDCTRSGSGQCSGDRSGGYDRPHARNGEPHDSHHETRDTAHYTASHGSGPDHHSGRSLALDRCCVGVYSPRTLLAMMRASRLFIIPCYTLFLRGFACRR